MKIYRGEKGLNTAGAARVTVNDRELSPERSQRLWNHSPDGFQWGYGGSGPAQLALAILLDFTRSKATALDHYQAFKWAFVAKWGLSWEISGAEIRAWLESELEAPELAE